MSVFHLAVGGFDKAEFVDLRKRREGGNQTDVLSFRRLDGAKPAVVRVVYVADLEGRSVPVQSAGSERGELSLMRQLRDGVGLIHELRQLRGAEEFLDGGRDRAHVNEALRGDLLGILRRHAFLYHALQTRDADAELVLQKLAHASDAAVPQVVDIVDSADPVVEIEIHGHGGDDIVHRDVFVVQLVEQVFLTSAVTSKFSRSMSS